MSLYKQIAKVGPKIFSKSALFKHGFNLSPMYRRSTGRIVEASEDLMTVKMKLPISWKNRNYVNSIFGGSMFSAVDPVPMVQLINIIGDDYVVWDKSAEILFKRPAKEHLYADFTYSQEELEEIKENVAKQNEIEITKLTRLTNASGEKVYCEVVKKIYVADKKFYKEKLKSRSKK